MLDFEQCRKIAEEKAGEYGVKITKAYSIANDFVFDSDTECIGIFPLAVYAHSGEISGIWNYLNRTKASMDDMKEIELCSTAAVNV